MDQRNKKDEMLAIMRRIDSKASALLLAGSNDMELFVGMFDHMADFKVLLDSPFKGEIESSASRFPALHHYAVVLTTISQGIANGSIKVPR